jgi:hypothetical protein
MSNIKHYIIISIIKQIITKKEPENSNLEISLMLKIRQMLPLQEIGIYFSSLDK